MMRRLLPHVLTALVTLAIAFGAHYYTASQELIRDYYEFRKTRPAAYWESEYWSPAFIDEQKSAAAVFVPDMSGNYLIKKDYHGRWINVEGGVRRTTDQPTTYAATVWLFGASTLYGSEVPDEYTIASYLQRLMPSVRVVNMGNIGGSTGWQAERLTQTAIQAGDVVVLYGGANEVNDYHAGVALEDVLRYYTEAITRARDYTDQHGARLVVVLQPHLFSKPLSDYERDLETRPYLIPPGMRAAFRAVWPRLQTVDIRHVLIFDLTHVLDEVRAGGVEVFLDYDHIVESGNSIVAFELYKVLKEDT